MIMFHENKIGLIKIFLLTGILFFSGCGTNVVVKENIQPPFAIKKILIFPFKDMSAVYGENVNTWCRVCGKMFMTGKVAEGANSMLTEQLFVFLKDRKDIELIPTSQSQGALSDLLSGNKNSLSERNLLIEIGRVLDADAIMAGYIYRFRERIGTKYSADLPASVAFDIHLIRIADGRLLWSRHFDETQRSLSENLFQFGTFLKRKARWITAQEMAVSGMKNILKDFKPEEYSE